MYRTVLQLLTLGLILLSAACDSTSSNAPAPITSNYSVYYTKGPIDGGSCTLYQPTGTLLAGPVNTVQGVAYFPNVEYSGELLAQCSEGSYIDEATGATLVLPNTLYLRSTVWTNLTSGNVALVASPFTELAYRMTLTVQGKVTAPHNRIMANLIADSFGLDGVDIGTSVPLTLAQIPSSPNTLAARHAIALAALSQLLADRRALGASASGSEVAELINTLLPAQLQNNNDYLTALTHLPGNANTTAYIADVSALSTQLSHKPLVLMDLTFSATPGTTYRTYLELDQAAAPISVANFLAYVQAGFYDNTLFHRVIKNFVVQGGGFDATSGLAKTVNAPITNEANNGLSNLYGAIAMARLGNLPDSATSQFFINVVDNPGLDPGIPNQFSDGWGYAVFGQVVGGMDVIDVVAAQPTPNSQNGTTLADGDQPLDDVIVTRMQLLY